MGDGSRVTSGNPAGQVETPYSVDQTSRSEAPNHAEAPQLPVDEYVGASGSSEPPVPTANNNQPPRHASYNGWIPLSDIVAFFETVRTHNLNRIRQHYGEIAANGFDSTVIYDVLTRRFNVAPAQLEHDIGHQNPNPNRSITELTSNAVDAMNGRHRGDVNITIRDGRYIVEDAGSGMSAEDVFEKLLIPQLSGKSGEVTIGRFGIGFYTALVHLRNQSSRVTVDTKREGHDAIRLEFIRLNGELGVRVGRSDRTTHGTTVTVVDNEIRQEQMTQELASNMGYVQNRRLVVNGDVINTLDPSRTRVIGNGRLYVSEETGLQGKVVITVAGVKIEEFEATGHPVPSLMVFDFPLSTKLPESRNQIRVDSGVVNQVRTFIDAVNDIEGYGNKIAYLNGIAPMITELQRRNEGSERASDLAEYAKFVAKKYLNGKTLMPGDPIYNIIAQDGVIRVNDLYLGSDWYNRFDQPAEWLGGARILLTEFSPGAASGISYDRVRNIILLDRYLYEMHKADPAGLGVLTSLSYAWGSWGNSRASGIGYASGDSGHDQVGKMANLSPQVLQVIQRHPTLAGQGLALESLAVHHPGILGVLEKLGTILIRYKGRFWNFGQQAKHDRFIIVRKDGGRWCILKLDGTPAIEGSYLEIKILGKNNQFIRVQGEDEQYRLLNLDGTPAIKGSYRWIRVLGNNDQFIVAPGEGGQPRLLNWDMTPVIEGSYSEIVVLGRNDQFIRVQGEDRRYRLLNLDGTSAIEGSYHWIDILGKNNQFIRVQGEDGQYRLLNLDGTSAIEGSYHDIDILGKDGQFIRVRGEDFRHRLLNLDGTPTIAGSYRRIYVLGNDDQFILVWEKGGEYGEYGNYRLLNWDMTPVIEGSYSEIDVLGRNDQFIGVRGEDGQYRLLNLDGTPAIEGRYREIHEMGQFIKVRGEDLQYRLLNLDGTSAIEGSHNEIYFFGRNGRFIVAAEHGQRGVQYRLFNLDGTPAVDGTFCDIRELNGKIIAVDEELNLLTSLEIEVLDDANAQRNLRMLVNLGLDAATQGAALSFLSFPAGLFDLALKILPHTKMNISYGEGLLEALRNMSSGYNEARLGMLFDIGVSAGWTESLPQDALERLKALDGYLSLADLSALREQLLSEKVSYAIRHKEWDKLTQLSPQMRAYAYYLAMDVAELLPEGSTQIRSVGGAASFSLIDLNTAVRSHRGQWREFQGNAREAIRVIQRQTARTNPEVSASRIRHAMYHLGDGQSLLFIRELIQNSLDAIRGNGAAGGEVNVESFEENGAHVLRITDPVGMSFTDALNNLFIFGESAKGEEDLGKFGVGFFTIYPGAREVRIKTGTGDGKVSIFTLRPVYEGETVVDVRMSYVVRKENFKGTIIERISNSEIPALDAAMARSSTISYGRFLDAEEIRVQYNGRQVNLAMRPIAEHDVAGIGRVRIYEASENAFTVGGLFVKNIPTTFYETLPPAIRALVASNGIVIDLPGSTPLVRSRNDFVDTANFDVKLMSAVHAMLIQNYIGRFARGEIVINGIPEEYFMTAYDFAEESRIPPAIRRDAELLIDGQGLSNIEQYLDSRSFMQLLTLLPCLKMGKETISMSELLKRIDDGEEIDESELPHAIRRRIHIAVRSRDNQIEQRNLMDSVVRELNLESDEGSRELSQEDWIEDRLHRHWARADAFNQYANSYDAFLTVMGPLWSRAGGQLGIIGLSSFIERGAAADHAVVDGQIEMYFSLTFAEMYAHDLYEILSADQYPATKMQIVMMELIDLATHEMTHELLEQPDEWTHDAEFYRRQQQIATRFLRSGPLELEKLWRDLKAQYPNPTFMPATEFLKLLVTGRRESPSGASPAATPQASPTPAPQAPPAATPPPSGGESASTASVSSSSARTSEHVVIDGFVDSGETRTGYAYQVPQSAVPISAYGTQTQFVGAQTAVSAPPAQTSEHVVIDGFVDSGETGTGYAYQVPQTTMPIGTYGTQTQMIGAQTAISGTTMMTPTTAMPVMPVIPLAPQMF